MKKSVVIFVVTVFSLLLVTPAFALSRGEAEKVIEKLTWKNVVVRTEYSSLSNDGKILIKNGYAMSQGRGYYQPLPDLMPYFYDVVECPREPGVIIISGGECEDVILILGKWYKAKCTGIRMVDNGSCIAHFTLSVKANKVGKLLGVKKEFPLVVELTKWDDGWRYEKVLWDKMKAQDRWVKKSLYGFDNDIGCINSPLWQMHELKIYAKDYQKMLSQLEKTDDIEYLDTVAWVYKDHGNTAKAVKIYEERILPVARGEGGEALQKYLKYYEKIKK